MENVTRVPSAPGRLGAGGSFGGTRDEPLDIHISSDAASEKQHNAPLDLGASRRALESRSKRPPGDGHTG